MRFIPNNQMQQNIFIVELTATQTLNSWNCKLEAASTASCKFWSWLMSSAIHADGRTPDLIAASCVGLSKLKTEMSRWRLTAAWFSRCICLELEVCVVSTRSRSDKCSPMFRFLQYMRRLCSLANCLLWAHWT